MKLLSLAISGVQDYIVDGGIYFWGAGKAFGRFIPRISKYVDLTCVKGIVDKNQTGSRLIQGRVVPLISVEKFLSECTINDILIITTIHYDDILDLLQKSDFENKVRVSIYNLLFEEELDKERNEIKMPNSFRTTEKQMIPKKIHYCWFGKNQIPEQYRKWMDTWKKYCPDYEIIEWNESNYDIHRLKYVEQAYQEKKYAFVSDYARLDVVYNYGGIYLDSDVELIKNIDELLFNEAFCGFEGSGYVSFGLGFGATARNRIIKEMMQVYENKAFLDADGNMDLTPCPVIQTDILERHGLKRNGEYQVIDGVAVFPELVLCPFSQHTCKLAKNLEHSYMIHHFAASWNPAFAKHMEDRHNFYTKFL